MSTRCRRFRGLSGIKDSVHKSSETQGETANLKFWASVEQRICSSISTRCRRFRGLSGMKDSVHKSSVKQREKTKNTKFANLCLPGAGDFEVCLKRRIHYINSLWNKKKQRICRCRRFRGVSWMKLLAHKSFVNSEKQGICSSELMWRSEFAVLCLPNAGDFEICPK